MNNALICATAASDARMDGCEKPVMTNSGSGNQGITVYLPVVVAAEQFGCSREQLIRALALSNLVAAHIHYYMGHLFCFVWNSDCRYGGCFGDYLPDGGDLRTGSQHY